MSARWGRVLLVLLQPDVELEGEKREGEDCCLSPTWVSPAAARALWKPLAFGHWRELFHQEKSGRVLQHQQHGLVPGGRDDDTDRFLLLLVTAGSRVAKITCNYKCILLVNDLCCMLGIFRDDFPFHLLEQHTVGYFVACLPLLYMGCACFLSFCPM